MNAKAVVMLLALNLTGAAGAIAAPFAMVTDVKGDAWALEGAKPRKLVVLGYIGNLSRGTPSGGGSDSGATPRPE